MHVHATSLPSCRQGAGSILINGLMECVHMTERTNLHVTATCARISLFSAFKPMMKMCAKYTRVSWQRES